ncbi:hypothetical protein [Deinococcus sp.]|uniref:hypothetical protein n=1 Tax=Deinococcus sp. TaxID=47478 RepID=UPI003CC6011E
MARICAASGIRTVPIHGLHPTYASLALRRGVPVEVVSKQLGCSTVAFTLTQYRTVFQSERASWALDIEDMISGGKQGAI